MGSTHARAVRASSNGRSDSFTTQSCIENVNLKSWLVRFGRSWPMPAARTRCAWLTRGRETGNSIIVHLEALRIRLKMSKAFISIPVGRNVHQQQIYSRNIQIPSWPDSSSSSRFLSSCTAGTKCPIIISITHLLMQYCQYYQYYFGSVASFAGTANSSLSHCHRHHPPDHHRHQHHHPGASIASISIYTYTYKYYQYYHPGASIAGTASVSSVEWRERPSRRRGRGGAGDHFYDF